MFFFELAVVLVLGLLFGSFSTALAYRVPRKLSWGAVRSSCTSCKKPLGALQLIPVFSWLLFRGKCAFCDAKISVRYPLIEVISGGLCLSSYFVFGFSGELVFVLLAVPFLLALFFIDIERMILPDQLVFILLILGVLRLFYFSVLDFFSAPSDLFIPYFGGALVFALASWVIGFVMTRALKRNALGFGDVKFFLVSGLWLGVASLPYFMILSGVVGVISSLVWRLCTGGDRFPFGPALILSFYILLLYQGSLL